MQILKHQATATRAVYLAIFLTDSSDQDEWRCRSYDISGAWAAVKSRSGPLITGESK